MNNEQLIGRWRNRIIKICVDRLGRELMPLERRFITSRGGFIALEMIEDTVRRLSGSELENYLNSETNK